MATLRDRILNNPSALPVDNVEGMGDFRQGLRNALIGAEANTALAEESAARAAGDAATADARAQRVNLLRAQQGMTPLRVGRVEDIGGVGDAVDWAAGQLGSAAGSMAAPLAAGTATAAAGSLLSLAPNAGVRALGRGLRTVGTPAVPFVMNAEQMKGEFYGQAKEDPTLMANTSAQALDNMGNVAGAAGGALDTILPATVARGIAGAGLRQGLRSGGAGRVVGGTLLEGGTELGQGEIGRQLRGTLNPEQDTSGFMSDRINELAAGLLSGAPFAATGEMADSGWRRAGDTANRVGETAGRVAGQVVDLGQDMAQRATERGTDMFNAARGKVIDLKGELKERTSQARSTWEASQEEVDLLMGNPPADVNIDDPDAYRSWWEEASPRRTQFVADQLGAMQDDPRAQELLAQMREADPEGDGWDGVVQEGADYLLERRRLDSLAKTAARAVGEKAGELGGKAKDVATTAGSALWGFMTRRKQNRQGATAPSDLIGDYLATETKPELTRYAVAQGDKSIPRYMRQLGNELSAMIQAGVEVDGKALLHLNRVANHMVGAYGPRAAQVVAELSNMAGPQGGPLINALAEQVNVVQAREGQRQTLTLRRQAADALLTVLPPEAEQRLMKEGVNLRSDEGKRQLLGMVEAVATGRANREARSALEKLVGAEVVVDMIQAIEPAPSAEAEAALFDGTADEALTANGLEVTDDGDVVDSEAASDYAKRTAEKNVDQGGGPTYYGFARRPTLNNSQEARDPFGYTERLTKDQLRERIASNQELPGRPILFRAGEKLASGEDALEARIAAMTRRLGEGRFDVRGRRVSEVMDDLNLEPMKRMQLFRDYMLQEAKALENGNGVTEQSQVLRDASKLARDYLIDVMNGERGGERKAEKFRTTPKERAFIRRQADRYFQTRFMAVAEPVTNLSPEELTPAAIKRFATRGDAAVAAFEGEARAAGLTGEDKDKYVTAAMARENVLEFKPVEGKRKVLYVKADDLVKWARTQRQNSTQSNLAKADQSRESDRDREYVSDLMVGVSAMVSGGDVQGLPKLGVQSFTNTVPAGLLLPSGRRFADLKGPKVEPTTSPEAVEAEQSNDQWFVMDDTPADPEVFAQEKLDAAFEDTRYRSMTQGFQPDRDRRAGRYREAPSTPRDLSTPRKFLTELQSFAEATRKAVTGTPDVLSDDPDVAGRYGASSRRQIAGVIEARKKEFEQFTEALAGFMMDSPFTSKQDALISRLTAEIGEDLGLTRAEEVAPRLGKPAGGARKRNAQSVQIHNDLKRGGFAATHDSPHRFDGRFNWRAHKMKGEGAMVFGAGTYLSTGDKVHSFYKAQFTAKARESAAEGNPELANLRDAIVDLTDEFDSAMRDAALLREDALKDAGAVRAWHAALKSVDEAKAKLKAAQAQYAERSKALDVGPSPTYQVSVQIMPSQLLLWDKPREKQSKLVQRVLAKAISELGLKGSEQTRAGIDGKLITYRDELSTGEQVYKAMTAKLGSMEKASDWLQANGVLGHEYAASNGRDGTTPNYVIYDDSKIVTNYVHFNAQTTAGGPQSTPEAQAEARDYIKRVLGPKIKVEFQKLTGYSGEWVDAENTIYISTTPAPGTMQVAYHEALHAFFSKWVANDQRALDVLQELADNEAIMRRVRALIGNDPAALDQLKDGEERLAYIFQFWAAGALQLPYGKPTTLLRKVTKFLRRVAGMVTDLERSVAIFEALHRGDFGKGQVAGAQALQKALQQGMTSRKAVRKLDGLVQKAAALTLPAETILKNSASQSAKRIGELFFVNPGDDTTGKEDGYLNARDQMARRYVNEFSRAMDGLQESDYKAVGDYMAKGTELADIPLDIHREAVKDIRALLKRFRQYMVDERGVKMGDQGDKYFPRVWSLDKLVLNSGDFLKMMAAKYPDKDGLAILASLTQNTASDIEVGRPRDEDGVLTPLNRSGEERVFSWMAPEDAAPFLETNLVGVLTRYFHEGVRAAEYTARFGQNGEKLEKLLIQTDKELFAHSRKLMRQGVLADEKAADAWHQRQYRDVRESVGAMEGTLGKDISAGWRATNSWVTVYQNIRLLPLSLFASVVDPMGMIARGAEMGEAYEAFKRGITEVGRQWRDIFKEQPTKRQADEWERMAQYVGSVDAAMFESQVSDMYASVYMSPTAKKWNDTFFKLNGMEAWNRGMRIGATKAAVQFIQRHASLPVKDSKRWLEELGLKPGDIELDADGKLLVSVGDIAKAKGINRDQAREIAQRLHTGINRWVTGAVLTPNAAQRPAWSSDPHYSMFFHLKQFTYSFHQTILKRAVREGAQGNIAPMMSLFWYVPIMVGADLIKGVIQGGGELPTHMKGMDAGEWLMYGAERSGIMGLGTLGVDAHDDLASLGGPMVEQIVDAFGDPLERTAVKALPANPLYREALI